MALPDLQQARDVLSAATRILIVVPEHASTDAVASMIALYMVLNGQREGSVDEVNPQHVPMELQFLPGSSQIMTMPQEQTELALDIAGPDSVEKIRTEKLQGGIRIHISLQKDAHITKEDIETTVRVLPYDAVVVLGASDLERLGSIFTTYTDFFYSTPIINIDRRANNEHFGTVNIVDITAGSIAEVTHSLIKLLDEQAVDKNVATALYAGIVAGTESFQLPSTTPRSFQIAAEMMAHEADRESVIQHLVKTKPLTLLKLTGRLYARLRYNEHEQLFWSIIRPIDFSESGANLSDIPKTLRELTNNVAGFTALFVLIENPNETYQAALLLGKGLQQQHKEILQKLNGEEEQGIITISLNATLLEEAEQEMLTLMQEVLPH